MSRIMRNKWPQGWPVGDIAWKMHVDDLLTVWLVGKRPGEKKQIVEVGRFEICPKSGAVRFLREG